MSENKISVIIPVYNVEPYLVQCLDSVYNQNVDGLEVICVNDGSTDSSYLILKKYKEKAPDLIIIDRENGGLSAARNSGFKAATGKYIYFLDSDDYLLPDVLGKMIKFMEANDLELGNFNVTKSDGKPYFTIGDYPQKALPGKEYVRVLNKLQYFLPEVAVWLYLYLKSFLDKNSLTFKEGILHEDMHFTEKALFCAQRVQMLNVPIQFHRIAREGSITQFVNKRQISSLSFIGKDLYRFYQVNSCDEKTFYDRIFRLYINVAAKILILGNYNDPVLTEGDYIVMKKCLIDKTWAMHYLLLRHRKYRWYKWYIDNSKSVSLKKNLRRLSKVYWWLFVHD